MATPAPEPRTANPHAHALQACVHEAVAEGAGLVRRWVAGVVAELRLQESGARSYREKTEISQAIQAMATHQAGVEAAFVGQWEQAIQHVLKGGVAAQGVVMRKSLAQVRFDELELMDDDQVQATVETARVLQAVQVSSEQALNELTARLCRAQGLGVVKVDHNPFRPEVVVQALSRTLEAQCRSTAVRSLWLQHGSRTLASELDVLYRHLGRLLDGMGVRPADYARVVSAPGLPASGGVGAGMARGSPRPATGGAVRLAPGDEGAERAHGFYANQVDPVRGAHQGTSGPSGDVVADFQPSSLFTLSHLHQLLLSGANGTSVESGASGSSGVGGSGGASGGDPADGLVGGRSAGAPLVQSIAPQAGQLAAGSGAASNWRLPADAADSVPLPDIYLGPDRRRRPRGLPVATVEATPSGPGKADAAQLADLAEEVVGFMLDGLASDGRLLAPVRAELRRLRPLLLRVAREDPRFFADRHNPARCLLDEVIAQSLAFVSEDSEGFATFLGSLRQVVQGLLQADSPAAELLARAMHALQATRTAAVGGEDGLQAHERAVAALIKAEQRFLLAEKVAEEIRERKDVRRAPQVLQRFLTGPWSQVVASARLVAGSHSVRAGQLPAEVRYFDLISDLAWTCAPEVAGRNRVRLVRVIPLLLRNLREGLHSIGYPQEKSCEFFNQLMVLQEAALKASLTTGPSVAASADGPAGGEAPESPAPMRTETVKAQPWVSPQESADTGFMDLPDEDPPPSDFVDTQPMSPANWDVAEPVEPPEVPDLVPGSWIELLQPSGEWQRAQLVWSSPHGTMYLFSMAAKPSVSMTRRNFQALVQRQRARCVAVQSVVDDALDHVMDAAVRNSVTRSTDSAGPAGSAG